MTDPEDPNPPRDPNPPPVTEPARRTTLHEILWFLEQCRLHGYRVGPVFEYDGARMQITDIKQAKLEGLTLSSGEPEGSVADWLNEAER